MIFLSIRRALSSIPATTFKALRRAAEAEPKRSLVLPVTIVPSGSSIATAGLLPVVSLLRRAALTVGRSVSTEIPA